MRLKIIQILFALSLASLAGQSARAAISEPQIANELGWVPSTENRCGGYYLESPFIYPDNKNLIQITSNEGLLFSQKGTSVSEGKVTITRGEQQTTANKAFLYRDPQTGKVIAIDLVNHVILRQPNDLVIAESAHYDWQKNEKELREIFYRMAIYGNRPHPEEPTREDLSQTRKITQLTAWGHAGNFKQTDPKIFVLKDASYSTCPPLNIAWQVKASNIELNKNTGRGYAKHARVYVKGIPIIYAPYINFPIDSRRQTGFLWPTFNTSSKYGGISVAAPYYWNMAPNYDMTITPAILGKRGIQGTDFFRYLTPSSEGKIHGAVLPNDALFRTFQETQATALANSTDPTTQAELRRLENAATTRNSFSWQDSTRYNDHWTSDVDYNYVSDDYYLRDLSPNLNEVTQNQLMQQGSMHYKNQHWRILGQIQGYQTLHPVDQPPISNQYFRLPQLNFEGDYPDSYLGLNYFVMSDLTRFDVRNMPGGETAYPIGNRYHIQPGISKHYSLPYFYFDPRLQFAGTQYEVGHVIDNYSKSPSRALPIFDISSGLYFDRNLQLFKHSYTQTLEPKIYYTYVPYENQSQIPVFDTTNNMLTYDQLFTYNRFSGLDRIGDANQISMGITTRMIDQESGYEKIRLGIGEILYLRDRLVTLCNDQSCTNVPLCTDNSCTDYPGNPNNKTPLSPLSGMLTYFLDPNWSANADAIWNPRSAQFDNQTITLHYQPYGTQKIINVGYSFVRQGDVLPGDNPQSSESNLSQTDFSFSWPFFRDWSMVGRWTQNWNHRHFQNLLYGLQYDSCCWAVRMVTGRAFTHLNSNNTYQYNTEFMLQFALKGLGNIGSRDPTQTLNNSINGYQSNFGRDF